MSQIELLQQRLEELTRLEPEQDKPVVLIVDDESLNRYLVCEALGAENYTLVEAESGAAAIEYIRHNSADLILLDIDMPGMSGLAVCEAIRALPQGALVPIAIVTGLDDNHSIESAFNCGATDFLTKPVNWTLMRQRVRFMLRHGAITRELQRNEQIIEQAQELAHIGHWRWDLKNHVIHHSASYCRLIPGLPPRITDAIFGDDVATEYGRRIVAELKCAFDSGEPSFGFECDVELPGRGKRRLLYRGTIEFDAGEPRQIICTAQDITERHEDQERYAAIFETCPVGILETDCSSLYEITQRPDFATRSEQSLRAEIAQRLTDNPRETFVVNANAIALNTLASETADPAQQALREELTLRFLLGVREQQRELVIRCEQAHRDGVQRHLIVNLRLPRAPEEFRRILFTVSDITELVRHEAQIRRAEAIIANSSDGVAIMDKNRRVLAVNPAYTRLVGYTLEEAQALDMARQLPASSSDQLARISASLRQQDGWRGEIELQRRDKSLISALLQINIIRNSQGEPDGYVAIVTDISHIKESERRLYQLAHFDKLTGLPNRLSLQERLQSEFQNATHDRNFCLLYIDLDGFKLVNDSMGHPTGDALLRELSARLRRTSQPGQMLARIGGDEFALMMAGATNAQIDAQGSQIFKALETPFRIKDREIFIGASIGVCRYPDDAGNAEEMLRNADSAMYEAKRLGRGQLCYYSAELTSLSNHRLQIENELRVAIASEQLFLAYQPKYDAQSSAMIGAEALVRWRNPARGIVPPGEFIGIAEASGLIIPLGEWVIQEACRQIAAWQREHNLSMPVAINISALHLREQSLSLVIREAIERSGINPRLLEIEITEDSLDFRGGDDKPYLMLNQLSELGLSIAIDDFGTGYSSLSQLKKMPISTLKIDRSFVRDIADSESDHAIITAIVGLAKTLDMAIVAEGVENEEQAKRLRVLECNVLQGFLFSKPVSPEELLQKFAAQPEHIKNRLV